MVETTAAGGMDEATLDTFPKLLLRNAERFADRPAFRLKDLGIWQTWTWAETAEEVRSARQLVLADPLRFRARFWSDSDQSYAGKTKTEEPE